MTARTRLRVTALLALALAAAGGRVAHAQAFSRLGPGEQAVTTETGVQAGMVTSLGYAAGLALGSTGRTLIPFAQATLLVAHPDLHDYGFRAGAQSSLVHTGWFDLSAQLAFEVAGTENSIYQGTALRTDLVLLAGHYARRWFAVAEAGYDRAWLTHIENSAWYRDNFYSGAQDGWYTQTGGNLHTGLKAGWRAGAVELVARAGVTRTETLQSLDLPFYATVGANYRF